MIAALYSSRSNDTKALSKEKNRFGWSTTESVYKSDMCRAENGISRRAWYTPTNSIFSI